MEPARQALEDGDVEELRRLLDAGLDPDHREAPSGTTLLQLAVDCEADGATQCGTPLEDAMTALLLERGADPFLPGRRGETAWDWAHRQGHDLAIARFLQWAARRGVPLPPPPVRLVPAAALGVDAALPPVGDADLAHRAVEDEDHGTLRRLLDAGLDPDARHSFSGATLLQRAVAREAWRPLSSGAPLEDAMTAFLLGRGADPTAPGCHGETAWDWAHHERHHLAIARFRRWAAERGVNLPSPAASW